VNIEEFSKNNEETIKNNVKTKQLVTQPQSNHGGTLKNSESSADAKSSTQLQLQLTAHITVNNNLKKTSNFTAKKGKSIIPARRLFLVIAIMEVSRKKTHLRN
jgi:hypothetical protein